MGNLKLNEAVIYAKKTKKVKKYLLAKVMWPDSSREASHTNFSNLCNGKSKKIDIDAVPFLCRELGVSADFLFGMTNNPKNPTQEEIEALQGKMHRLAETIGVSHPELEEMLSLF